jgi:hypothetical protein
MALLTIFPIKYWLSLAIFPISLTLTAVYQTFKEQTAWNLTSKVGSTGGLAREDRWTLSMKN